MLKMLYSNFINSELIKSSAILSNNEKVYILRLFIIHGATEQALHWIIASSLDWIDSYTITNTMGLFFDNEQETLEEKYMWIRAYALINIIHEKNNDITQIMRSFVDLMEVTKKFKFFPSIAFSNELRKNYLECLTSDPRIKFFTLISNKMYKSAFNDIDIPEIDDEEWKYFNYLKANLQKYLNVKVDVPYEKVYVDVKEHLPRVIRRSDSQKIKPSIKENFIQEFSSSLEPKKLF